MTGDNGHKRLLLACAMIVCFSSLGYTQEKTIAAAESSPALPKLISLAFKDVNIEDALKVIAEASGLNIILDNDVRAKVSINLKEVPWQIALDNLLKTNEFTYKKQGNIIRIITMETLKREEETLPLLTKIILLNFAKAEDIQKSLAKIISPRGTIEINIPTNSLIISDSPETLLKIEEVVTKLDTRTPQVMIEALIISLKLTDTDKSGMDWTATHKKVPGRSIQQSLKAPTSAIDLFYGKTILPGWSFTSQMNFFEEDKRVNILANPRILTLDNLPAQIEINEQVPYTYVSTSTESSSTVTSTQFKDIGIKLYVTPHITKDKIISLKVKGEQSFVASFVGSSNEPSIDSRKVETNFMLKDGDTVVIGGLKKKDYTNTVDKIPLLGDIPFVGKLLFSKIVKEAVNTELIIFITPRIMDESTILTKKEESTLAKAKEELGKKDRKASRDEMISHILNEQIPADAPQTTTQ
jgi:type IV pilus assembly protein PilQ